MKLVWLSDLHFVGGDELVAGHDPRERLRAAVHHINSYHHDADYCVISGDLVNRGTLDDYLELKGFLDQLTVPFLLMVGNHDNRGQLKKVFSLPKAGMDDFVQYAVETDKCRLLCLDTQKEGNDSGEFCNERQAWLRGQLSEQTTKPALVFMHHPPATLGLPMQDQDRMENGPAFLDLLNDYSSVAHLCIGHVHRPITGQLKGISFTTMRSVLYQAPAPVPTWDWGNFKPAAEAPAMGIVSLNQDSVIIQFEQFCPFEVGITG
jgi:3',5'-cyclic-AMP phosphodiesterase